MAADKRKQELADKSNRMLDKMRHLRDTEQRKRQTSISTPAFHELADDVNATSREIFKIAREQETLGDAIPTGEETIDDADVSGQT
jgi:hypothetical protein